MDKRKELLITMLQDKDLEIRKCAALAIEKLETRDRLQFLTKKIETGEMLEKVRAIYALADLKGVAVLGALVAASKDQSEDVRAAAARMLGNAGDPSATPYLIAMLNDPSFIVQRVVVEALSNYKGPDLVDPLIKAMTNKDPGVIERALDLAGRIGDKRAEGAMLHFAEKGNTKMRCIAIKALGEMDR